MEESSEIKKPEPDVGALIDEYTSSGSLGNFWNRIQTAEDTRLARWDSQNDDGKKHAADLPEGEEVFPFEGASDVRCYQADEVCNENVDIDCAAFWQADLRVQPVGIEDASDASNCTTFLDWLKNKRLHSELVDEVELSAQYRHTYGWCILHPSWRREIAYKLKSATLEELSYLAGKMREIPPEQLAQLPPEQQQIVAASAVFPDLVRNPETEQQAADIASFLHRTAILNSLPKGVTEQDLPELKGKAARKMVKSLREEGSAEVPFPYLCRNQACIRALRPWRDVVIHCTTTDIQQATSAFVVDYITEASARSMVLSDNWDADFVEQLVKTKGAVSTWTESTGISPTKVTFSWQGVEQESELIEIIWAYKKQVDEYNVSGVYYTICSAHIRAEKDNQKMYAKHGLLNYPHNEYPLIPVRRELLDRAVMASRGIPELLLTSQREEKVTRDAQIDLTSLAVVPPLHTYKGAMGQRYKFGPAVQNEVTPGREPRFLEIPNSGLTPSVEVLDNIEKRTARYFGRFHETVPPPLSQLRQQGQVKRFLSGWGKAFQQTYHLYLKFAPEIVEKVTGSPSMNAEQYDSGDYDLIFHFDVAQLHPDLMEMKAKAFSQLLSEDSEGVFDRAKWMEVRARMVDPKIAKELIMNKTSASEQLYRKVMEDVSWMSQGNEAIYQDAANDPTAPSKLQYAMTIVQKNIRYLASLDKEFLAELFPGAPMDMIPQGQVDPIFTQYLSKYIDNLKMGADQQKNKLVGRTGVKQSEP